VSSAPLLDVVGWKGSRSHPVVFPQDPDGLSAPPPRWGRFLIFDHLVSNRAASVERQEL